MVWPCGSSTVGFIDTYTRAFIYIFILLCSGAYPPRCDLKCLTLKLFHLIGSPISGGLWTRQLSTGASSSRKVWRCRRVEQLVLWRLTFSSTIWKTCWTTCSGWYEPIPSIRLQLRPRSGCCSEPLFEGEIHNEPGQTCGRTIGNLQLRRKRRTIYRRRTKGYR